MDNFKIPIVKFKIFILKFLFLEKEAIEMRGGKKNLHGEKMYGDGETDLSFFQVLLSLSFCVFVPNSASNKPNQISYLWAFMQRGSKKIILTFFSDLAGAEGNVFSSLLEINKLLGNQRKDWVFFSPLLSSARSNSRRGCNFLTVQQDYFIHLLVTEREMTTLIICPIQIISHLGSGNISSCWNWNPLEKFWHTVVTETMKAKG